MSIVCFLMAKLKLDDGLQIKAAVVSIPTLQTIKRQLMYKNASSVTKSQHYATWAPYVPDKNEIANLQNIAKQTKEKLLLTHYFDGPLLTINNFASSCKLTLIRVLDCLLLTLYFDNLFYKP